MTDTDHIVKAFDVELGRIANDLVRMGGLVESQIELAVDALGRRDSDKAQQAIDNDRKIDGLESTIEDQVVRLFALRQPMAVDLRFAFASLRIANDLERMGDLAKNIAKRAIVLNQLPPVRPIHAIPRMTNIVQRMLRDVIDSYVERDPARARSVWHSDEEVDEMYNSLFREALTYMMEDPRRITGCTHLLFVAKNVERMGDHATNVAEQVVYLTEGARMVGEERPKIDSVFGNAGVPGGAEGTTEARDDDADQKKD